MFYKVTNEDRSFSADTYEELAEKLWQSSFNPPASIEEWMEGIAHRARQWDGTRLRTGDPKELITDMITAGLIKATGE